MLRLESPRAANYRAHTFWSPCATTKTQHSQKNTKNINQIMSPLCSKLCNSSHGIQRSYMDWSPDFLSDSFPTALPHAHFTPFPLGPLPFLEQAGYPPAFQTFVSSLWLHILCQLHFFSNSSTSSEIWSNNNFLGKVTLTTF